MPTNLTMNRQTITIDATQKVAGRLASEVAKILQGKNKVDYQPNVDSGDFVKITNVHLMKFTGKKIDQKIYYRYTGHPGGIRETKLKDKMKNKPDDVLRDMVLNMLPKNTLQSERIKRLSFEK